MRTIIDRLTATAILSCVMIATSNPVNAALPDPWGAPQSEADSSLRMDAARFDMREEGLADQLDATAQFAIASFGTAIGDHPLLHILRTADLSEASTAGDARETFSDLALTLPDTTYRLMDLGYDNPGTPVQQSVSWALIIGGIGFAAALFRLSRAKGPADRAI